MKKKTEAALARIQGLLENIHFPRKYITRQTAICLYALLNEEERSGLLTGKKALSEGARIHDIMEFARAEVGIRVAENTRESYRKTSLKPLFDAGLISRIRTSVNDPNTHYLLNRSFAAVLKEYMQEKNKGRRETIANAWLTTAAGMAPLQARAKAQAEPGTVTVTLGEEQVTLSPGKHNLLIKHIAEVFAPIFIDNTPQMILLSDAEHKLKYVHPIAEKLGLKIDKHEKMPDVILYSPTRNIVYIVEAVTSAGPINEARIKDIEQVVLPEKLTFGVEYFTAFPDRTVLKRFLDEIAWGTQVWLANEPFGVIIFRRIR